MQSLILKSLIEYPELKDEFENRFSISWFDDTYKAFVSILLNLKVLSFEAFESSLSEEQKKSEEFLKIAAAVPKVDFLDYDLTLRDNFKLKRQEQIGLKLLQGAKNNQILDLSLFEADFEAKMEFLNLKEWLNFYKNKPILPQIKSGIIFIDSAFNGGFELGQLVLISGDAEAGKTTLGLQILENMAKDVKTCFFCFEFTIEQYLKRKNEQRLNFNEENFFIINDGYDINEIIGRMKILYKKGVKVFLIDSQMRITSPRARNMEEEESLKFSSLAKLAHSHNLLIFLIIQTAKGDRDNPMGSKKGTHEASIILRVEQVPADKKDILQKNKEFNPHQRLFLVRKNKQTGKHFKELVHFDEKELKFYKIAYEDKPVQVVEFKDIEDSIF